MAELEDDDDAWAEDENLEDMYLTFSVAGEEYAVGVEYVTEIVGLQEIVQVPDVPDFVRGVINLRGRVVPVLDARLRFGLPPRDYDHRTVIVVLDVHGSPSGLVVDRVDDVAEIPPSMTDPPPQWRRSDGARSSLIRARCGRHLL